MKRDTLERRKRWYFEEEHPITGLPISRDARKVANRRRAVGLDGRVTHCVHGHEYTPENSIWTGRHRMCRVCHNERDRERKDALRPTRRRLDLVENRSLRRRLDLVENRGLREAVLQVRRETGVSWFEIARRAKVVGSDGEPDTTRLQRALGVKDTHDTYSARRYRQTRLSYALALRIVAAINRDPVDVDL